MEILLMDLQDFHLLEEIMNELGSEKGNRCVRTCSCDRLNDSFPYISLSESGLRGAPGYSLEQAHHLPIEMDSLVGE